MSKIKNDRFLVVAGKLDATTQIPEGPAQLEVRLQN